METYLTEEERLEALQRWWKENRSSVFGGLLLGLVAVAGVKIWQGNKLQAAEQASQIYIQLVQAVRSREPETVQKLGERLVQQFPSTTYAEFAHLFLARFKVEAGDLAGARKLLEEELSHSHDEAIRSLTRLRLGRIMLAMGEIEPALTMLAGAPDPGSAFAGLYAELRGDLLTAARRPAEARAAYAKARELGNRSPLIDLKLNDLPASS